MEEEVNPACPRCLGQGRRVMSATNFILKGSGFYVNDYPSESRKKAKKEEKEAGKPPDKSKKPESKKEKAEKNP
jgi:predicted nucleic acid-binding Zn ribbon protein